MNPSIDLEAAKAAFFASGGQLVVLEGFTYQPLPQRKHPDPAPKRRRGPQPVQDGTRQERARARAEMVSEMAKTMTCREAAQELRVSQSSLWDMAKRFGFAFVSGNRGKHTPNANAEERDAVLAERIRELLASGSSRNSAAQKLEIGHTTVNRIASKYGIEIPNQKRRAKS